MLNFIGTNREAARPRSPSIRYAAPQLGRLEYGISASVPNEVPTYYYTYLPTYFSHALASRSREIHANSRSRDTLLRRGVYRITRTIRAALREYSLSIFAVLSAVVVSLSREGDFRAEILRKLS